MVRLRLKALTLRLSRLLNRSASSDESAFAFFIFTLILGLAYRIQVTLSLFNSPVRPFDFNPAVPPVWFILRYLPLRPDAGH